MTPETYVVRVKERVSRENILLKPGNSVMTPEIYVVRVKERVSRENILLKPGNS
jgi:hypothetical protein